MVVTVTASIKFVVHIDTDMFQNEQIVVGGNNTHFYAFKTLISFEPNVGLKADMDLKADVGDAVIDIGDVIGNLDGVIVHMGAMLESIDYLLKEVSHVQPSTSLVCTPFDFPMCVFVSNYSIASQ